jgi:hypothetical protein
VALALGTSRLPHAAASTRHGHLHTTLIDSSGSPADTMRTPSSTNSGKCMLFLSIKITTILLICFILLVKLKGKCRVATQVQRLIFLQEELIHGSTTMYVQLHHLLHQVRWHLLHPTTAASLELLPQIQ